VKILTISICVRLHPQFAAFIVDTDNLSSRSCHLCNTEDWNIKIFEINPPKMWQGQVFGKDNNKLFVFTNEITCKMTVNSGHFYQRYLHNDKTHFSNLRTVLVGYRWQKFRYTSSTLWAENMVSDPTGKSHNEDVWKTSSKENFRHQNVRSSVKTQKCAHLRAL